MVKVIVDDATVYHYSLRVETPEKAFYIKHVGPNGATSHNNPFKAQGFGTIEQAKKAASAVRHTTGGSWRPKVVRLDLGVGVSEV